MKVLLFDNYDSFTYNLLHILKELGAEVEVHRNDKISLDEVERFDKILLSPSSLLVNTEYWLIRSASTRGKSA